MRKRTGQPQAAYNPPRQNLLLNKKFLAQTQKRQDRDHDYDQSDDVDNIIHELSLDDSAVERPPLVKAF